MTAAFAARSRASASSVNCCAARLAVYASIDGLVDPGNDDGGVAGELAGSVDGVAIPGTAGKSGGREQRRFSLAKGEIQEDKIAVRGRLLRVNALGRGGEMRGGGFSGAEVEHEPDPRL